MRFFTVDWWRGEVVEDRLGMYRRYFESIRDQLPANLIALEENVALHDARLRELAFDSGTRVLRMSLEDYEGKGLTTMEYHSVIGFESFADPAKGLSGPYGYGDLGYDEVDVLPDGRFEHRILFSSGIGLRIRFADISYSASPLTSR